MFKIEKNENEFMGAKIPKIIRFTDNIFMELNEYAKENEISYDLLVLQCCKYALENIDKDKI